MSSPRFTEDAWYEYIAWQGEDKKTLKKINNLIKDIMRNGPDEGEGKPEALKGNLSGLFSRRINEKDRLVYRFLSDDVFEIISCQGHYDDK